MARKAKALALRMTATADVIRIDAFLAEARARAKTDARPARKTLPVAQRLEKMLDKSGQCHLFKGSLQQASGYGQIWDISPKTRKPTMRSAHVVAWELANPGKIIPEGMDVCHARGCPKHCCNGRHLRIDTAIGNMADAKAEKKLKSRKLSSAKAIEIGNYFDAGRSVPVLAKQYGVSNQAIKSVITGKSYAKATGRAQSYVPAKSGRPKGSTKARSRAAA